MEVMIDFFRDAFKRKKGFFSFLRTDALSDMLKDGKILFGI